MIFFKLLVYVHKKKEYGWLNALRAGGRDDSFRERDQEDITRLFLRGEKG